jgi:hypothetical protein
MKSRPAELTDEEFVRAQEQAERLGRPVRPVMGRPDIVVHPRPVQQRREP